MDGDVLHRAQLTWALTAAAERPHVHAAWVVLPNIRRGTRRLAYKDGSILSHGERGYLSDDVLGCTRFPPDGDFYLES
jgi:hypothetical protein